MALMRKAFRRVEISHLAVLCFIVVLTINQRTHALANVSPLERLPAETESRYLSEDSSRRLSAESPTVPPASEAINHVGAAGRGFPALGPEDPPVGATGSQGAPPRHDQAQDAEGVGAEGGSGNDAPLGEAPASGRFAVPEVRRCVIILGTGRSGSTQLMDAVNQLPGYYIQGEQEAAFWYLYESFRAMEATWLHANEYRIRVEQEEEEAGPGLTAAAHRDLATVKEVYESIAPHKKQPWFNDLHPDRLKQALRAFYYLSYGHHGPDVVSGFKEIRFGYGLAFPMPKFTHDHFVDFMSFLRLLCLDVKFLLNTRTSSSLESNMKLAAMVTKFSMVNSTEQIVQGLPTTHEWYDRYAREHPDHAFRVLMEDMFDAKRNGTLARRLLAFLGEDPNLPVRFDRMPSWSDHGAPPKRLPKRMVDSSHPRLKQPAWNPWVIGR